MSPRALAVVPVVAALVAAAPAGAADQSQSVTATGTAQIKVEPKNRKSESSIEAAVEAARKAGIPAAIKDAHGYALQYAHAAGLTLGAIESVSDATQGAFGYGPGFYGSFGPNQFCGTVRQPIFKVVAGKRKVVGTKKVHRCFVPPSVATVLTVTYSAT
jgi:uncharacterized protein YggE